MVYPTSLNNSAIYNFRLGTNLFPEYISLGMYYNKPRVTDVYDRFFEEIKLQILRETDAFIIGTTTKELVDYFYQNKHFTPIEADEEIGESANIKKEIRIIRASERESFYQNEGDIHFEFETFHVSIALKINKSIQEILKMRPSSMSMGWSPNEVKWNSRSIDFSYDIKGYGFTRPQDNVAQYINNQKQRIYSHLQILTTEINSCNSRLKQQIELFINSRKEKLESDVSQYDALLKQINIPVKRKDDEVIKRVQIDHTPLVQKVRPVATQPENYTIDSEKVVDIIHIIDNQGRQFEKTPKTFMNSGEEDFRNVILVGLNALFEGNATGETFMAKGKTDIYLNIAKGNILVCECKIWGGQKLYGETIDQILSYLTWRVNYGVIITFVRNKSFTNVLTEHEAPISRHLSYRNGFKKLTDTHFISQHSLPTDNQKNVELHHLFYHVDS